MAIIPITTIHTAHKVQNASKVTHLYLYGDIVADAMYDNDVSPSRVKEMLDKASDEIVVHISSYGGDAFAGIAIYNLLKDSGKKITTQIDSIGASSASIIAMAGEQIVFSTGAQIMIHNPSTMCWGDKADFEKTIASLDKCKDAIIEIYNTHAIEGVDYAELMSAETWANGETAKTIFANIVTKDMQGKEAITNRFQNRQQQFNQILTNQNQSNK
jgi:ATP-dependent Clp protease protease subunit